MSPKRSMSPKKDAFAVFKTDPFFNKKARKQSPGKKEDPFAVFKTDPFFNKNAKKSPSRGRSPRGRSASRSPSRSQSRSQSPRGRMMPPTMMPVKVMRLQDLVQEEEQP